jgi:DNA-binding PadR family transcriptional regulator
MPAKPFLGEFEQMVLLAIVKHENAASGVEISRELEESAGRSVARGALYTTLDRLERKGLLRWRLDPGGPQRSDLPKRRFTVRPKGIAALRATRGALLRLWDGTEGLLDEPGR